MNTADRAIVAAAEERDRAVKADLGGRSLTPAWRTVADRRELLRIVREQDTMAGHRTDGEHDCFAMNCARLGSEVERLRHLLRERDTQAEDRADDAAATRATAGKWGGGL